MSSNKKQWLSSGEATAFLKEHGMEMSLHGLLLQSLRHGFAKRASDDIHWLFDREQLEQYVLERTTQPEADWITIHSAAAKLGIPVDRIYYAVRTFKIETKTFGRGGVRHVKFEDCKKLM